MSRDLAKNWDIDIATALEDYLEGRDDERGWLTPTRCCCCCCSMLPVGCWPALIVIHLLLPVPDCEGGCR